MSRYLQISWWMILVALLTLSGWIIIAGYSDVSATQGPAATISEPLDATDSGLCWRISGGVPATNAETSTGGGIIQLGQYINGNHVKGDIRFRFGLAGCLPQTETKTFLPVIVK